MEDDLIITCNFCGRPFEPTPECFVERTLSPSDFPTIAEVHTSMDDGGCCLTLEDLCNMDADALAQFEIDEAARQALLRGETVVTGAQALCPVCLSFHLQP